jgi:addiction module RelE/StbE family toxin
MNKIILSEQFEKSFDKIKDKTIIQQAWHKIQELKNRAPIGKKLKGHPFWSIRVNRYRIIYVIENDSIVILDIIQRKNDYREI